MSFVRTGETPAFTSEDFRRSMEISLALKAGRRLPPRPGATPESRGLVVDVAQRCPTPSPFNGANCRRRRCPHCGAAWLRSVHTVSRVALEHAGDVLVMISVTAPGADLLPWSCGKDHEHSGTRGCRVKADYADLWAADAPERLTKLREAARLVVKRKGLPVDRLWLEKVWEPQRRGVPHVHIVCGASSPAELEAAEVFYAAIKRLAPEYRFGEQVHMTRPMQGDEIARYLVSYLMGRSKRKGTIRDNLGDPRMPRNLVYVARTLTRETGVTMRRMRVIRWYWAALTGKLAVYPRIFGEELFAMARACTFAERSNAPPELRYAQHLSALRLMRRLSAAPA